MIEQVDNDEAVGTLHELEEIESVIAKTHGFYVSRDDPILIQFTMNKIIMEHNVRKFSECLKTFKEEMALEAHRWEKSSNDAADRFMQLIVTRQETVLNIALEDFIKTMKNEMENSRMIYQNNEIGLQRPIKTAVTINLVASLITLSAAILIVLP